MGATFETVIYEVEDAIATIRMSRPQQRNALNAALKRDLVAVFQHFQADRAARVGILTGEGSAFSAGGDIREFTELAGKSGPEIASAARLTAAPHRAGLGLTKPLVAAVNGPALGSGFGLAALCHFAVAAEGATFGITPVRMGVVPLPVIPAVVRAIGYRKALQLAMTAEVIDAPEARRIGLVDEVVAPEQVLPRAREIAAALARQSPTALRGLLEAFPDIASRPHDDAFERLVLWMVPYYQTEDLREGTAAFVAKRSPRWTGR